MVVFELELCPRHAKWRAQSLTVHNYRETLWPGGATGHLGVAHQKQKAITEYQELYHAVVLYELADNYDNRLLIYLGLLLLTMICMD